MVWFNVGIRAKITVSITIGAVIAFKISSRICRIGRSADYPHHRDDP